MMNREAIVRAWKDPELRTQDVQHPAGYSEVPDSILKTLGGGTQTAGSVSNNGCTCSGSSGEGTPHLKCQF